jgi:hypothetical protein
MPAVPRLTLLVCALALVAALPLYACGDGGSATAESSGAAAKPQGHPADRGRPCPAKVDAFVAALADLRRQLAVGLSYDQYAARIEALRGTYAAIPVDRLTLGCLATTGSAAERAFNEYIEAANSWGECLADAACTTATIEPDLQRRWRLASRALSTAL